MTDTLIAWIALVEGLGIFGLAGLMMLHVLGLAWWDRRRVRFMERARGQILLLLEQPDLEDQSVRAISSLAWGRQVNLLAEFTPNLTGSKRELLNRIAIKSGLVNRAEKCCRSHFWWRRLQGIRVLCLVDAGENIVPAMMVDSNPMVRCQAAEWAANHPTPPVIEALVRMLISRNDPSRFSVRDSLLHIGHPAVMPVRRALMCAHGRDLVSLLEVAAGLASPEFLNPGLALAEHADPKVREISTRLLGALGGEEAMAVLTKMLGDGHPEIRRAAVAALGKLGHWTAAYRVAELLQDEHWMVRREAGLTLKGFGAPGSLLLQHVLRNASGPAADMARQVLDIPSQLEPAS